MVAHQYVRIIDLILGTRQTAVGRVLRKIAGEHNIISNTLKSFRPFIFLKSVFINPDVAISALIMIPIQHGGNIRRNTAT